MTVCIDNVTVCFMDGDRKRVVLNNISTELSDGSFTVILGASGCGKTTMLNVIGGLLQPSEGKVLLDGIDYYSLPVKEQNKFRRKHIGYIFQEYYLIEDLTPLDNVQIMMADGVPRREKLEKAKNLIREVGLETKMTSSIKTFSGGEKQRLAIARALAQEGELLLCDEPTGNLDEDNTLLVMDMIRRLCDEGKTIVMVTHDRSLCRYADRVIVMKEFSEREGKDK